MFETLEARKLLHAGPHADLGVTLQLIAVEDASVRGGTYATTNYGDSTTLEIKKSINASYDRDGFVRFDLATLTDKDISAVTLRLFAGNQSNNTATVPLIVRTAGSAWAESTLVYNNRPALTDPALGTISISGAKKWFEIDVTAAVQAALDNHQTSLEIGIEASASATPVVQINSSEAAANAPELVAVVHGVVIEPPPVDPPPVDPPPVDPPPATPVTIVAQTDAHVRGGSTANTNFGQAPTLEIKYSTNAVYERIGYVRFDLTTLANTIIPSAKIRLFGGTSQSNAQIVPVTVSLAQNTWSEATVTYNNRPAIVGETLATFQLASAKKWFEVDVTAVLQSAINAGKTSLDIAIAGVVNLASYGLINSSEAATNRPELVIGDPTVTPQPLPIAWQAVASVPQKREEAVSFDFAGQMYVIGGYIDTRTYAATQRVDRYNPANNSWTRLQDAPTKITHAGTAVDEATGTVWMAGGFIGNFPEPPGTAVVWKYSPATDTWARGPDLPEARAAGGAAIVGRTLYFFMGSAADRMSSKNDTWSLDLDDSNATWQTRANAPAELNHFGYAAVGGKIYAIGGQMGIEDDATNQSAVLVYDPQNDSWMTSTSMPTADSHFHAATDVYKNRYIIHAGGEPTRNRGSKDVMLFDTQTQTWRALTTLPQARRAAVGTIIGDQLIVGSGYDNSVGFSTSFWKADLSVLALA